MMKRSMALLVGGALSLAPAYGQTPQTRTTLYNENNAGIFPNTLGLVTPQAVNSMFGNTVASAAILNDVNAFTVAPDFPLSGLLVGNGPGVPITAIAAGPTPNAPNGVAILNAAGTLAETNLSTTAPALYIQGQSIPNSPNSTAIFSNDGASPQVLIGNAYYDTVSAVLDMCSVASSLQPQCVPFLPGTTTPVFGIIQQDAFSGYVDDGVPQGPVGQVLSVNSGANQFTLTTTPPPGVVGGNTVIVSDVSAPGNLSVASAVKAANGTGGTNGSAAYQATGGTCITNPIVNATWAAGVLTVNSINNPGNCKVLPTSPATLAYVAGSGPATGWTGATVTLTPVAGSSASAPTGWLLGSSGLVDTNTRTISTVVGNVITMSGAFGATISPGDLIKFYTSDGSHSSNGVSFQGNTEGVISNTALWGADWQVSNLPNQHYSNEIGIELDMFSNEADASVDGLDITGLSTQSGLSQAIAINQLDVVNRGATWGAGIAMQDGCCGVAIAIPAAYNAAFANINSAPVEYFYSNGSAAGEAFEFFAGPLGFLSGCTDTICNFDYGGPIRLYDGTAYDELLGVSAGPTALLAADPAFTAVSVGNGTAPINLSTATLKINSTSAVSCAAGTVTLLTEVVTNGIVTHC